MGSEYCLGRHGAITTPQGVGTYLMAYEMSGTFDVYTDLPKCDLDLDAWDAMDDAARVNLWSNIAPDHLFQIGLNIMRIAKHHISPDQSKLLRNNVLDFACKEEWLDLAYKGE